MKKVYIWGAGKNLKKVYAAVNTELCKVMGIVDGDINKQGKKSVANIQVEAPEVLLDKDYDCILIAVKYYQPILAKCNRMGIKKEYITVFWEDDNYSPYVDYKMKRIIFLEEEAERLRYRLENLPYEIGVKLVPNIDSSEKLLKIIIDRKVSLCRFGDGEFEIMCGRNRPWFQEADEKLALRLREIIDTDDTRIMIAIADNFGGLEKYTENAADTIRKYVCGNTRKDVMNLLNFKHTYFNAYVSRPYIMYKDRREHAKRIFDLFKQVWKNRNLLIVEGRYSGLGAGNDLFSGASRIRRIICPEKNAFYKYDVIIDAVKNIAQKEELILISLGPTATVLAYDLANCGMQALDIGQLDNEYEWYLREAEERVEISGKGVAELGWCHQPAQDLMDNKYTEQIIVKIE